MFIVALIKSWNNNIILTFTVPIISFVIVMAKSNAERQRQWRARQYATIGKDVFKDRRRIVTKERRRNFSAKQKLNEKVAARIRMRKLRDNRKANERMNASNSTNSGDQKTCAADIIQRRTPLSGYSCTSTLGKAVKKVQRALPNSPTKTSAVLKKIVVKLNIDTNFITKAKTIPVIKQQNVEQLKNVQNFYRLDSISRQAPGVKDVVRIRDHEGKHLVPKRHLLMKLREVYELYKIENKECDIGFSKFCYSRPADVLLNSELPTDVCLCEVHENFISLVDSLFPNFPYNHAWVINNIVCDSTNITCLQGKCDNCNRGNRLVESLNINDNQGQTVKFLRWEKASDERLQKVQHTLELGDAISTFRSLLPRFMMHQYTKRTQQRMYESDKEKANDGRLVIQIDFAENYTCFHQAEIQSAHWNQRQVSLFTMCVWSERGISSYVVVSDNLTHDKVTAISYLVNVLDTIIPVKNTIQEISIWSDGPSSQFKNRYIAFLISKLCLRYNLKSMQWNYFCTSHGKGPVDGVGAAVKRGVRDAVKSRACSVQSASEFVNVAKQFTPKITLLIGSIVEGLFHDVESAPAVPGIKSFHYIKSTLSRDQSFLATTPSPTVQLETATVFSETDVSSNTVKIHDDSIAVDELKFAVNDYVIVRYNNQLYPGVVVSKCTERKTAVIKAMKKATSSSWQWPQKDDILEYPFNDIIQVINSPKSCGTGSRCNNYKVPEMNHFPW